MIDIICLGVDSLLVSILYLVYKNKAKTLSQVENSVEFNLDKNDKEKGNEKLPNEIEYAMVVGKVFPESNTLKSHYKEYKGVIRKIEVKEHGTRFENNVTRDTSRILSYDIDHEPFKILRKNLEIKIDKPLNAHFILDNLHTTYKLFEANTDSLSARVVTALLVKERVKGISTSEHMLLNGTQITCFGKLEKISSSSTWVPGAVKASYRLIEPENQTYIITTLSRQGLIDRLKSTTKALRISIIIFGAIGAGLSIYVAYPRIKEYVIKKRREYRLHQARILQKEQRRILRLQRGEQNYNNENSENLVAQPENEQNVCVVCLVNPREVILLDCGHVCLCMDCLERLPTENCPVCRVNYRTFAACYLA